MMLAAEIAKGLQDAESPMDFIRKNLAPAGNDQKVVTQTPEGNLEVKTEIIQPASVVQQSFRTEDGLEFSFDTPNATPVPPPTPAPAPTQKTEPAPQESQKENAAEEETPKTGLELLETVKKTKEDSLKDLRKKTNELKTQIQEKDTLLSQAQAELERYKKGEAIPEVIQQKEARIAELEHFERLHNLKFSSEYQKKFVEPLESLKQQAVSLAEDYNVSPQVLNHALQIDNKKELHSFLAKHFDPVGALEVKETLSKIKDLDARMSDAEAEPEMALSELRAEFGRQEQAREVQRVNSIVQNSQRGWAGALSDLRSSGEYPELTISGNAEQDRLATDILNAAASEYGKFVKLLGTNGMKELPEEVAKITAKRFLLSQAAGIMAQSRAHHYNRAEEIVRETQRTAHYARPPIGGGTVSGSAPASKPSSPLEAADLILSKIGLQGK